MQSRRPLETAPGRPKAPLGGSLPSFDALSGPHLYRHPYRDAVLDAVPADGAVLCLEPRPVPCPIGLCPKIFRAGLPRGLEPSRHFETNSLPVRLYSHGRSGRKGRVLPGRDHAEPAEYRAPVSSRFLRKNFPPEFWGQTRYDTCNSTLCGPRHDPRDFLFSEEGRPIF